MKPLVSVLIDTYNQEKYIEQAVVSAIEQDFPAAGYEILVVDDGSTDRTPEIVKKFAPRVRLLSKQNGGQASAYNFGVERARGEVVAFLDGDDWFAPGKLSAVMSALEEHPEAAAVGHGYYQVAEPSAELHVHTADRTKLLRLADPQGAHEALLSIPFLHNSALTVRRRVLERAIPISEALVFCADAPVAITSMAMGLLLLDRPLLYYRVHAQNLYASIDPTDLPRTRRRCEVEQLMFEQLEALLVRQGVRRDCVEAFLYPWWIENSRSNLSSFGGKRIWALQTEMRWFRLQNPDPGLGYRLFKYGVVGLATLLLGPRLFYRARNWYGRSALGRLREQLTGR